MTPIPNSQFPIPNSQSENPNITWAVTFVNELARAGLTAVCIAPGSRSTPLTLAFDAHPDIKVYLHLDERSAAFFALGLALETDEPVALVCTSGTATANFYPAVIEAHMSQVPLLVLSTDRPPELRHSGANQTIDQVKMFGNHVLWAVDMDVPTAEATELALRNVKTTAVRAYATANGLRKGPVQVNFPFRKPLEPGGEQLSVNSYQLAVEAQTVMERGEVMPSSRQMSQLVEVVRQYERGLIVCGPRCPGGDFPVAVARLARACGYPLVADPLSGVRFGRWQEETAVIASYESQLVRNRNPWGHPDVVIRFGQVPTSKWLNDYLDNAHAAHVIHVRENGVWADDSHRVTMFLQASETAVCTQLAAQLPKRRPTTWLTTIAESERRHWAKLRPLLAEPFFDVTVVAEVVRLMPRNGRLIMGNSLPIRHLDQFGQPHNRPLHIFGNRGASGIDGNVSTALGVAAASHAPTVLVVGDITFYHDLNGLLAVRQHGLDNVVIVLLNNNGGGIFNRLPVATLEPPFTKLFITPHGLDFAPVVGMYGLGYTQANSREAFTAAFQAAMAEPGARVIEVRTNGRFDEARRREIVRLVNEGV
ncbi:MAG: 2-succinyl-5-enolpyruvyl-6-hydroxy-3-cyclohexene-1-carboxylic-acid synthase [Chloroflexota bacterium]